VAPIGSGFGDVVISLPVIDVLIDRGEDVWLVTRSFRQVGISPRIVGIRGEVAEENLQIKTGDRYVNLRKHPLQTDHVWGSDKFERWFGPTRFEKIISIVANDFGIATDFQCLRPLQFSKRDEAAGKIAFIPGSDGYYKHWPTTYWLQLRQALEQAGLQILVIGKPDESPAVKDLIEHGLQWIESPTAGEAIDLVSSCRLAVSVDTGLMHVALQQGIPTVAFIHPSNYHIRTVKNCFNLFGIDCPEKCGREPVTTPPEALAASELAVSLKFDHRPCQLAASESCMGVIQPDKVLELMNEHLPELISSR
jgi:Glycosyltransferase family 9 (heptosyltransferase)